MSADGGFYLGTDLKDKTFYGFRLNVNTGDCNIEVIGIDATRLLHQDNC